MVTGGTVSIEDGSKKAEEYAPPRKVRVELHFDVAEGAAADQVLAAVSALADAQVAKLLGSSPKAVTAPAPKTDKDKIAEAAVAAATPAAAPPKTTTRTRPKPIEVKLPPETVADVEEAGDPFADDAPAATPPKEVTDKELHDAMTRKAAELGNAVPIKTLVGTYRPAGSTGQFSSHQIPQEKRGEFMEKLAGLKKAA